MFRESFASPKDFTLVRAVIKIRTVKFNMLEMKGTRVVFENLQNDFPQKIVYEYRAPDQLDAHIEGKDPGSGQQTSINFPMRRKGCGS